MNVRKITLPLFYLSKFTLESEYEGVRRVSVTLRGNLDAI